MVSADKRGLHASSTGAIEENLRDYYFFLKNQNKKTLLKSTSSVSLRYAIQKA